MRHALGRVLEGAAVLILADLVRRFLDAWERDDDDDDGR